MSVFSQAVNGFRSTASRAGKFYNSPGARRAMRISKLAAKQGLTGSGAAAVVGGSSVVGGLSGAAVDRDHRMRGAVRGAALGAIGGAGYRLGTTNAAMRSVVVPAMYKGASALRGLSGLVGG